MSTRRRGVYSALLTITIAACSSSGDDRQRASNAVTNASAASSRPPLFTVVAMIEALPSDVPAAIAQLPRDNAGFRAANEDAAYWGSRQWVSVRSKWRP
jgi:hypothetical protein